MHGFVKTMESLLPSEIARLVYGYLEEEKCAEAAHSFLEHSPHMVECLAYAKQGKVFTTTVAKSTLMDILEEYCAIRRLVTERLQKMPEDTAGQIRRCATLIEQLCHLLDASKAGQTLLVSVTIPPQGSGSQSSSNLQPSTLSSRTRARLFSNAERSKRTSVRWQGSGQEGNKHQRNKDAEEESSSAPYSMTTIEATPLESLPGLADSRSMQTTSRKDREEGEKQMPKTSTPSKLPADVHDPMPGCSFVEDGNISSSSPKRKHYSHSSSKRKCNNPTPMKNQTPAKARWSHTEENDSNESVDISVLTKALLGNTELHEKLAENINSVICPTEQNQTDPAPQTSQCDGMINELNNAIKTIVSRTESDPLFEKLLEEIIGPEEEEMTPSPAEMQSESDDAATKVSAEEEVEQSAKAATVKKRSLTPGRIQPQPEVEPTTEVPLKQRLRSARQRKSDGAPNAVSPATMTKEKKKETTVLSLEDQNAAAIQCIVNANLSCKQGAEKEVLPCSTTTETSSDPATLAVASNPSQSIDDSNEKHVQQKVVNRSAETVVAEITKQPETPRTTDIISTSAANNGITTENDKSVMLFDGNVACVDAAVPLPISQPVKSNLQQLTAPLLVTMTQPAVAFTIPTPMETVSHIAAFPSMSTTVPVSSAVTSCINGGDIMTMPTVIVCGNEPALPHLINPASAVGNLLMPGNNRYVPIAPKDRNAAQLSARVETVPFIRQPLTDGELSTVISGSSSSSSTRVAKSIPKEKQPNKQNKAVKQLQQEQQSITLYGSDDAVAEVSTALSLPPICLESPEFKKPSPEKENAAKENPEPAANKNNSSVPLKENEQDSICADVGSNAEKISPEVSSKSSDKAVMHNVPLSPQLLSLVSISTRKAESSKQKESPNKAASVTTASSNKVSRSTPQTCLSQSRTLGASSKRLSLSTPRRRRNHVRALDFTTPPKSGIGSRRPNTSPKLTDCKRITPQCVEKFKKSVRRTGLFKSPPSVTVHAEAKEPSEAKAVENDITDGAPAPPKINSTYEAPETEKDVGEPLVKLPENEAPPIATRSPFVKLSGGWDNITGVGLILNNNTSPTNSSNKEETLTNGDGSSITNKGPRKEQKIHKEKSSKPKEVTKSAWDADLRSLLNANTEKFQKRKSKRISKSMKQKKVSQETENEAKQLEDNLSNSTDNTKENVGNGDNATDTPVSEADGEVPKERVEEVKKVTAKGSDVNKSKSSRNTNYLKVEKMKKTQGTSKRKTQKSKKVIKDDKSNENKDSEPSRDDISEPNQGSQETENSSSCIEKVIQSPTKLNASKRTLVHHNSQLCQKLNMEEPENSTETLLIRTEESDNGKMAVIASNGASSANELMKSRKENASPLPPPILKEQPAAAEERTNGPCSGPKEPPILDTPQKVDAPFNSFWGADMSLIAPITPRVISPSEEDTPITKLCRDTSSMIHFSTIQTPSCPPTPNIAVTPQSFISGVSDSPSSYATRPTDYSSCSSYYRPSVDNANERVLEQVLISECQRIESVKNSAEKKGEVPALQEKSAPEEDSEQHNGQEMNPEAAECETENAVTSIPTLQSEPLLEKSDEEIPFAEEQDDIQNAVQTNEPSHSSKRTASSTKKRMRRKSGVSTEMEASKHVSKVHRKRRLSNIEEKTKEQMIMDHIKDAKLKLFGQNSSCDEDSDTSESEAETPDCHRYPLRSREKQNEKINEKASVENEVLGTMSKPLAEQVDYNIPTVHEKVSLPEDVHKLKKKVPVHTVKEATHLTPSTSFPPKDSKMCLELEEKKRRTIAKLRGFELSPEAGPKVPSAEPSPEQQTLTYSIQNVPRSVEALASKTKLESPAKKSLHLSVEAIAERLAREKNALPAPQVQVQEVSGVAEESSEEYAALRLSTDEELDSETSRPQSRYAMVESQLAELHGENESDPFNKTAVASSTPLTAADLCNDLETPIKSDTDDGDEEEEQQQKDKSEATNKSSHIRKRLKDLLDENTSPIKSKTEAGKSSRDSLNIPYSRKDILEIQESAVVETTVMEKLNYKSVVPTNAEENPRCSKKALVDSAFYVEILYQGDGPKRNPIALDLPQFESSFADDANNIIKFNATDFQELFCYFPPAEAQCNKDIQKESATLKRKSRTDTHEAHLKLRNRDHRKSKSPQKERISRTGATMNRVPSLASCVSRVEQSHWPSGRHRESPSPPRWQSRGRQMLSLSRATRRNSPSSCSRFNVHRRSRSQSLDRRRRSPSHHRRRRPSLTSRKSPPPLPIPPSNQKKSTAMISPLSQLYEECAQEERKTSKAIRNTSRHMSRSHKAVDREPTKRSRRKEADGSRMEQSRASNAAERQGCKTKEMLRAEDEMMTLGSARDNSADDTAVQESQNQARDHYGQSHTLPPKKRKASSDEAQTCFESKRPRTEVPKDLLKKVDLDHLLDFVHGEKLG